MIEKLKNFNFKKPERQTLLLWLAVVLTVLVGAFSIYVVMSLASDLNQSLSVPAPAPSAIRFDIRGFESLKLIR